MGDWGSEYCIGGRADMRPAGVGGCVGREVRGVYDE